MFDQLLDEEILAKISEKRIKRLREKKLNSLLESPPTSLRIAPNKMLTEMIDVLSHGSGKYTTQQLQIRALKNMKELQMLKYLDNEDSLTNRLLYLVRSVRDKDLSITAFTTLLDALNLDVIIVEK